MNTWIEHLHHPLVFAGFGLFLFALIIKPLFLNNKKLTGTATERLLSKGMILVFLLALLAIIGGIVLSWKNSSTESGQLTVPAAPAQPVVQQPEQTPPSVPPVQQEATVDTDKGATLNITSSGEGQVSIGGDVINAKGNVEKNDAE